MRSDERRICKVIYICVCKWAKLSYRILEFIRKCTFISSKNYKLQKFYMLLYIFINLLRIHCQNAHQIISEKNYKIIKQNCIILTYIGTLH